MIPTPAREKIVDAQVVGNIGCVPFLLVLALASTVFAILALLDHVFVPVP